MIFPPATPFQQEKTAAPAAANYVALVNSYSPAWYLPLSETVGTTATAQAGANGTYVNSPQLGVTSIAQDDVGGKSVGLSGVTPSPPYITVTSPLSAASITLMAIIQLDTITDTKQQIITHSGGAAVGQLSIEVLQNGQVRCFSDDATNVIFEIIGSAGNIPQGTAVQLVYQRQSNVAGWSQRCYVNGVLVAEDTTQRTWPTFAAGTLYIGTWFDGTSFFDPMDGLIAHVAGWNSLLTPAQIVDLARATSVAWAENIDAGSVQASQSTVVDVRQGGWHGKLPLTVTAGDGALVTTTESSELITILAGSTTGTNDTFSYSFTDANGNTSQSRTVTIDVTAAPSGGVSIGALNAFQPKRVQMTALSGWPAGRTPKEVVTQGTHVHGYVRRAWKQSSNDGTWMDFQAGWRKTTSDTIRIKLDNNSELDVSCSVDHFVPIPGSGGVTRTLDKLGGADFTTWTNAIANLNANDVLVVRARAGGEMYPVDVNTGGPVSTVNGVKIVAHPDDLSAGRRPRIHQQGTVFARYADDLNAGHWEVYSDLGTPHGKVYRSTQVVGTNKSNIGCSYRTKSGELKRCYTYTNTPGSPGALARLTDKTYPRITRATVSGWALYMGPGIYLHTDGKLYIRLSPLRAGVGAIQVNASAGKGSNPPYNWSDFDPANENPNLCQLYISSTNQYGTEGNWPTNTLNYLLRINNRTNWTLENLDFVAGGNTIEMNAGSGHTLRGCRFLAWAPPNMEDQPGNAGFARIHNMLEASSTHNIVCDRCEFWGGMVPWYCWEENKGYWGAYSSAQKPNLWYMYDGTADSVSLRFVNSLLSGFASITIRFGKLRYLKFHHSTLRYCGMDGLTVCLVAAQTLEFLRSQLWESQFGGYVDESAVNGSMYLGYCMITNVRPHLHDSGWWDTSDPIPNQFVCSKAIIGHGTDPGYKDNERHFYYNNTAIGTHNHLRASTTKTTANMVKDGAGAFLFPNNVNRWFREFWSRNNVLAVRPNGSLGDSSNTRAPSFGDSHVAAVLHQNHVGNAAAGGLVAYSMNYNIYHRGAGMPILTAPSDSSNGVITTVNSGGTETARNSITDVRNDTGQENNGSIADPLFVGVWSAGKLDHELHTNAFWCLQAGSPAASGGDTTDRTWLDMDFGTQVSYLGNAWRGCMDPLASAVEQQVGTLGPMIT